jgi:3-polyprenyl-4-hydroxybenzoate decarboxylase
MRDPEADWVNGGTYRAMVQDKNHVSLWISPGKHGRQIRERQAGLLAAGCQSASYLGRFVVVVDEDVDPSDLFDVMWAMCKLRPRNRHRVRAPRLDAEISDHRHRRLLRAPRPATRRPRRREA